LIQAGLHGAVAALASLYGTAGGAEGGHIDLSAQQVVAFLLGRHFACYPYAGRVDSRLTPPPYEPMSFYPCRDGHIFLICPEEDQYARLLELMGNPDWSREPRMAGRQGRERNSPEIKARLSEWTAQWEAEALFHACQKVRVGAAPVYDYPGLERSEHLQAREFFVSQEQPGWRQTGSALNALKVPGAPFHFKYPMWDSSRAAPRLGEANGEWETLLAPRERPSHGASVRPVRPVQPAGAPSNGRTAGPLSGIRVLDLSWVWAGPQCTWMLASLGAEVIKVENSGRVDLTRRTHTFASGMEPTLNRNGFFNQINQGKESIAMDLSHPEGRGMALALAARSDVVISNFGHGVLEKLGLTPEALQAENPGLTVVMISACGQTGPSRAYLGYGPLISPLAGISAQTGYGDGEPRDVGIAYGDPNAAVYAAVAITATLLAGNSGANTNGDEDDGIKGDGLKSGGLKKNGLKGQVIDISMWEAMLCTAFEGWMNHVMGNPPFQPMGNRHPHLAPHNVYACAGDDAWVAVAAETGEQFQALCEAIGRPELAADPRFADAPSRKANEDGLDRIVGAWCAGLERWEAVRRLQAVGVPAMPSLSSKDLAEDPHLLAREAFTHAPHAEVGARPLMGMPWKWVRPGNGSDTDANTGTEESALKAAPCLGADTQTVLQRLLGLDAAAISNLRERGVIE
ncbi:MAG: CoA transferase, partial [bacterium]